VKLDAAPIRARYREAIRRSGATVEKAADAAKINPSTLHKFFSGEGDTGLLAFATIASVLKINPAEILGVSPTRLDDPVVPEKALGLALDIADLQADQVRALRLIVRAMKAARDTGTAGHSQAPAGTSSRRPPKRASGQKRG